LWGWVWFFVLFSRFGWFGRGSDTARFQPEPSVPLGGIVIMDELHELLELGFDFICFDVAICVDAVVKTVATDISAGAHLAIPFPVDSV
jgi:hypothetical protein